MMVERTDIVAMARSFVGAKWRHQGRTDRHLDCAGLVVRTAGKLGLSDYDVSDYPRRPNGEFVQAFLDAGCQRVRPDEALEGDVLIFNEGKTSCHCGILAELHGQPSVVHAHANRRCVLEETLEDARSVVGRPTVFLRLPGMEG